MDSALQDTDTTTTDSVATARTDPAGSSGFTPEFHVELGRVETTVESEGPLVQWKARDPETDTTAVSGNPTDAVMRVVEKRTGGEL